jgi:integrase
MATKIPRGIQVVKYKNKDKSIQIKYRVRISRQDFKADKLFDDLSEATEFLALSKSTKGKEKIFSITDKEAQEIAIIQDIIRNPPISHYIKKYIEDYVEKREQDTYLKQRNVRNIKSFYRTIDKTMIPHLDAKAPKLPGMLADITEQFKSYNLRQFGSLKPQEISSITINDYIKARLSEKRKKSTIARELTFINRLFQKLRHLQPEIHFTNPISDYDRDLLRYRTEKRDFRFSDEQMSELLEALDKNKNKEIKQIVLLSLYTAMRRSEVITLTWTQVKDGYIQLTHTKSGKPRKVYLTKEAKELLASIEKRNGDDRVFKFSITGFEGSFSKFKARLSFKFRFHDFRREGISRLVEKAGMENSVLLAEILGFANVRKLEEGYGDETASISSQRGLLKSVGHSNPDTTKSFYYSIKQIKTKG